jgi:hypothetical protein
MAVAHIEQSAQKSERSGQPFTHAVLGVILTGGLLIGVALGVMSPAGHAWFVLIAAALMAPITLGMLAGGISYPPYPRCQSEAAGVAMLIVMQSIRLLAQPGSSILRLVRRRAREISVSVALLPSLVWLGGAVA